MSYPYSERLLQAVGLTTAQGAVVPAGKRWIVSDVCVYWGGGVGQAACNVRGAGGQTFFIAENEISAGGAGGSSYSSQSWHWRGHQVLYASESLSVTSNGQAMDVTISGYELDD